MKILFIVLASLVIFSGCSIQDLDYRLRNKKMKKALYKQQQARKRENRAAMRKKKRRESYKSIPKPPIKNIKLKKVEDDNYSSGYMYPQTKKLTSATVSEIAPLNIVSHEMTKEECTSIIGQMKYDTYTQKFGSVSATLRRCKMLKAMK